MILAMRIDNFQPVDAFKQEMDRVIREIRNSEKMEGMNRIWLPGEIEFYRVRERLEKGIPIAPAVFEELHALAMELQLSDRLE